MTVLVLMLILAHAALMVLLLTYPKKPLASRWFYLPTLVIAWLGYLAYESFYIPRYCPGECNIRVDLLFIYPWLAFVTICSIAYFVKRRKPGAS